MSPLQKTDQHPIVPEIGIVSIVPDIWTDAWQPRHHIMSRLARYFYVVWMEPSPHWSSTLLSYLHRQGNTRYGDIHIPGFKIYRPEPWLPEFFRSRTLDKLSRRARIKKAIKHLKTTGCQKIVIYIWRPDIRSRALHLADFDLSCYHIDDEYSFSSVDLPLDPSEAKLIQEVDQVFIHSPGLMEKKGKINPHTLLVPNGADYHACSRETPEPDDMVLIPRPRIGYTGWIKKQLDWPLLLSLARHHVEWSFVFVGGLNLETEVAPLISELQALKNVHFLGRKSTRDIVGYPQHFDVSIMPYKIDDYTKYIYPMKLHEYLASGCPTVGSSIKSLQEFAGIIGLAKSRDEWSTELTNALQPSANTPERRSCRQALAKKHDWSYVVIEIAKTIAARLGHAYFDRNEASFQQLTLDEGKLDQGAASVIKNIAHNTAD